MRSTEVKNNHDKSTLKIILITISLSILIGIYFSNTKFLITHEYFSIIHNLGIFLISFGLLIRWFAILKLKKSFTVNVSIAKNQSLMQSGI